MGKQTLLWTTLPNGGSATVGGTLRLSVLVSPRLEYTVAPPKKELSHFPEMADWPARAKALKFVVNFSSGAKVPANIVSEIDSALWSQLFPPTTFVRGHVFERMDDRFILSYPAANLAKSMKGIYQLVAATSPAGYPSADGLRNLLAPMTRLLNANKGNEATTAVRANFGPKQRLQALKNANSSTRSVPPGAPNLLNDMNLFQLFHTPQVTTVPDPQTGAPLTKLTPLPAADEFQKRIDFHQMVSGVAKHPELMKRLGLLFDLEIKLPAAIPDGGLVWISVSPAAKSGNDLKPRTHYTTKNGFEAQPKTGVIGGGLLNLNNEAFDVLQVDVDGAAMKMLNLASTLQTTQQNKTTDTPQFLSVPSLRSGGLSVTRAGRAVDLAKNFDNSQATNAKAQALLAALAVAGADKAAAENANVIDLWAENLVRGFRIDVREIPVDALGKPLSSGTPGAWRSLVRRRGNYKISSTEIVPPIAPDEGATQISVTTPANAAPASKPDLYLHESLFRWAGWSLAAPRPGKTLAPDDTAQQISNDAPPGLNLEVSFKAEPGTLPRLRFGKAYQMRARTCDLAGNGPSFELKGNAGATKIDEGFYARFEPLASPTLLLTKELSDAQTPGESLERIVIRTRNTSPDKDDDVSPEKSVRHIAPPKTSQEMAELHGMFDSGGLNPADYATIADKDGDFESDQRSGRMAPDAPLELPYLPDPLATKALFLGLPGSTAATFFLQNQAFDGVWPNAQPFRLRVSEGDSGWKSGDRVLDIALPKAEIYTTLLYSQMPAAQIPNMGVYRWAAEALASSPAKLDLLNKIALAGVFWMTTPPRFLTFVHATQQPIGIAKWLKLEPARNIGDTFAVFQGALKCHGKSTGRVDVLAEWKEPIDNPKDAANKPDVDTLQGRANAWEMPLHIGNFRIVSDTKLPLSDTKGPYGLYEEATTTLTFSGRTDNNLAFRGVSNLRRHDFGDTKHRLVRYTAKSTTRFREYFPAEIRKDEANLTRLSDVKEVHVPSSARPDAPKVLYVIPTFRWAKNSKSSTRSAGLRVYLDRPWFSSGENELLGVVTVNPPQGVFGGGSADIDMLDSKTRALFEAVPFVAVEPKANTSVFNAMPHLMTPHIFDNATKLKTDDLKIDRATTETNALNTKTPDKSTFSATSSTRSLTKSTNTRALTAVQSGTISPSAIAAMHVEKVTPTEKFTPVIGISKTEAPFIAALGAIFSATPPPPPPAIPEKLKPYVTQWGNDPIWASAPTRGLASPQSFPLATALGTSLSLDENDEAVAVAGHTPQFDAERNLWYCDIEMNAGLSYFPFVRLALARFQPYSVEGAHLSRVVLADFAQLAARRSASWTRDGNTVRVVVSGPAGRGNGDAGGSDLNGLVFGAPINIGRVEVAVERRNGTSDLGWRAVPDAVFPLQFDSFDGQNPMRTWTGNVNLPDAGELRLVIREWEFYRADKPDTTSQDPNWSDNGQRTERLVYADVIEL